MFTPDFGFAKSVWRRYRGVDRSRARGAGALQTGAAAEASAAQRPRF